MEANGSDPIILKMQKRKLEKDLLWQKVSLASIEQALLLAASLITEFDGFYLYFLFFLLLFLFFVVCHFAASIYSSS
jgi:hypothetical protein